jgi:hypothetical protein
MNLRALSPSLRYAVRSLGKHPLWITRAISELLSNVGYADVAALLVAEGILFGVAIVACAGPVRQAIRADPGQILRAN